MFENLRKNLIQHCERSELRLPYVTLENKKKVFNFTILQPVFGQTVLPDSSIFNLTKIAEK